MASKKPRDKKYNPNKHNRVTNTEVGAKKVHMLKPLELKHLRELKAVEMILVEALNRHRIATASYLDTIAATDWGYPDGVALAYSIDYDKGGVQAEILPPPEKVAQPQAESDIIVPQTNSNKGE